MAEPRAETNILSRLDEIVFLEQILNDLDGRSIKNKRSKKSVVRKAMLSFIVTTWETYIEELIDESVEFLVASLTNHKLLPSKLRAAIGLALKEEKDQRSLWKLAGDGWKSILELNAANHIAAFNTPRPANIDAIFSKTLGLENASRVWKWKGISNAGVKRKLNLWITRRGEIVHQLLTEENLHMHEVYAFAELIMRCSVLTANDVRKHLYGLVGSYPWDRVTYKSTM